MQTNKQTDFANQGDTISRKAAIEAINTWDKFGVDERSRVVRWYEGLEPYVRLRDVVTSIAKLPSAQPELIAQGAYVRGFEQGRTQGMLDAKLEPTCNQLATDTISRQAAIDALEKVAELYPWRVPGDRDSYSHYNEGWNDAIGRAEIALEELPSAQPEKVCIAKITLSEEQVREAVEKAKSEIVQVFPSTQPEPCEDTVSRQRLLSDLKELVAAWKKYPVMAEQIKGVEAAIGYVEAIPSAQPEIIRCRNCKFASGDSRICMKFGHSPIGELDFCAWAERRANE